MEAKGSYSVHISPPLIPILSYLNVTQLNVPPPMYAYVFQVIPLWLRYMVSSAPVCATCLAHLILIE